MKDRKVQYPNRYKFTKVEGTDDIYEVIPAPGEIQNEGTFINKSTLLTDATAALFGLDESAVPDDVLAKLAGAALVEDGTVTDIDGNKVGPQIEVGSYVGNGKYGKSNPNSLTFSFIPKFWGILTSYEPGVPYDRFRPIPDRILLPWGETLKNPSPGDEEMVIPSYDGNKVSWYSNRGQDTQCSSNNYVYYYIAIG